MANLVQEDYFVCTDFDRNNNKFWKIQLFDDGTLTTTWGRVGITEQTKSWPGCSQSIYDKKINDKLKVKKGRDAYTKVDIVTSTSTSQSHVPSSSLEAIATRDVDVDCETTRDLIRWLSKVNIHNIVKSTTMTYNESEGVFRTPLGVVGKTMIDRARILLNEISPYIEFSKYDDTNLKKLATEYLRIIPQDLGGSNKKIRVDNIFTQDYLKKQADILDALDASIATILTNPKTGTKLPTEQQEPERVFNVKLHSVDDAEQIEEVKKKFNHTKQSQHVSYSFDFKKLYAVDLGDMRQKWEQDGAKLNNRMRLWHGTKPSNVLSILKQGLIIPPSSASFVCGRAYGNGVYFSDQSTKSLNYACGYWGGGDQGNRVFMFLADVGMGNYYIPKCSFRGTVPSGYDSCFAEAGKSGVANHEMITYRTSQCNLVYLVEFAR